MPNVKCPICKGEGKLPCPVCRVPLSVKEKTGSVTHEWVTCPECNATKYVLCNYCGGTGKVQRS